MTDKIIAAATIASLGLTQGVTGEEVAVVLDPIAQMKADLQAQIARLEKANAELTERAKTARPAGGGGITFVVKSQTKDPATGQTVDSKGCVSIYGVNTKFPVSLYPAAVEKLIAAVLRGDLVKAMRENPEALAFRDSKDVQVTDKAERKRLALACADRIEAMLTGAAGSAVSTSK